MIKFKHNKTGSIYRLLGYAVDCTNIRNGTECVVYCPDNKSNRIYVRDQKEFFDKFTPLDEQA